MQSVHANHKTRIEDHRQLVDSEHRREAIVLINLPSYNLRQWTLGRAVHFAEPQANTYTELLRRPLARPPWGRFSQIDHRARNIHWQIEEGVLAQTLMR